MAQFHWNYLTLGTGTDLRRAYINYLQNSSYAKDISDCIDENFNSLQKEIRRGSDSSRNIEQGIKSVCGNLNSGFTMIREHFDTLNQSVLKTNDSISEMSSMISWKLSTLIENQNITNHLLGNINQLLRIPDFQKERVYYIEEGLKYLKNALLINWESDFYEDAYNSFNEALRREPKDYLSLNKLGFIHLYSKKYLDFSKAEDYYKKSIRYSLAEVNAGGTNTSNTLGSNHGRTNQNPHLLSSCESLVYCARTCALQSKVREASSLAKEAYERLPSFLLAGYEASKYLCINGEVNQALPIISSVIEKDSFYALTVASDADIIKHPKVLRLLEEFKMKIRNHTENKISSINSRLGDNSTALKLLKESSNLANKSDLMSVIKGSNLLSQKFDWLYPIYQYGYGNTYISEKKGMTDGFYREGRLANPQNLDYGYYKTNNPDNGFSIEQFISIENEALAELKSCYKNAKDKMMHDKKKSNQKIIGTIAFVLPYIPVLIFTYVGTVEHMNQSSSYPTKILGLIGAIIILLLPLFAIATAVAFGLRYVARWLVPSKQKIDEVPIVKENNPY